MAVGVKILLACLLATHVASQVLAYSVLAKQYPQEVKHGFLQNSEGCPDILLQNGNVTYSKPKTTSGYWQKRTVASLRCNVGYVLLYNEDKMCLKSGKWSGHNSSCEATSCQKKFHDSGGCCTAKENDCYVGIDSYGNRCSCSANCYDNQHLKCCPDIGCPNILLENGIVTYSKSQTSPGHRPVRTVASLHCNVGYALLYDKDKMCLKSGMWSGDSSFCVAKSCQEKFRDSGGCCTAGEDHCYVGIDIYNGNRCSCSANCYNNQHLKCCPDIGCPSICSKVNLITSGSKFCSLEGKEKGALNCYLPKERCFCDKECCKWNDCCPDVDCPPKSTSQVHTEDPAVKELASELRSMSRVQELSNELQRAGWEAILRELQEIQKEK